MNTRRRSWRWLVTMSLLLVLAPQHAAAPQAAGRVLHVSPTPLAKVAADRQFRTLGEAARAVQPGDTVRIHSGTYRESVVMEASGTKARPIRFEAAPAANVLVTGADRLLDWKRKAAKAKTFTARRGRTSSSPGARRAAIPAMIIIGSSGAPSRSM